ncbi:hypothetical protein XENORESO_011552 [Xenotaenia resolanae]|uniref:Uncharacterized protein n=1 Tax=Xenotaenia resolanae TaxID=208358 RepID=A0ABV0W3W8_9TELE
MAKCSQDVRMPKGDTELGENEHFADSSKQETCASPGEVGTGRDYGFFLPYQKNSLSVRTVFTQQLENCCNLGLCNKNDRELIRGVNSQTVIVIVGVFIELSAHQVRKCSPLTRISCSSVVLFCV